MIFDDNRPCMGQDPFLVKWENRYLLIESENEKRIVLSDINLNTMERSNSTVVWEDPLEEQVWAPELWFTDGIWRIFYTASDGINSNHRTYSITGRFTGGTPFKTPDHEWDNYTSKQQWGLDIWGIDMTEFRHRDVDYLVWSGWDNNGDEFPQYLFISAKWNPEHRIKLSSPDLPWEKSVQPILEGPQAFHSPNGTLFISYSANASWTQEYRTGLLELVGNNPLNPDCWEKKPTALAINAGHGQFFEDKFVFHKKMSQMPGWRDREIVWWPFAWHDNYPVLM